MLDEPKVIKRGDKEIKYSKIPEAKWVRTFTMDNAVLDADESVPAPKRKRQTKVKDADAVPKGKDADAVPVKTTEADPEPQLEPALEPTAAA